MSKGPRPALTRSQSRRLLQGSRPLQSSSSSFSKTWGRAAPECNGTVKPAGGQIEKLRTGSWSHTRWTNAKAYDADAHRTRSLSQYRPETAHNFVCPGHLPQFSLSAG